MKNNNNYMFVRYYRKSTKYDLELNADLIEIIIGLMLGDLFACAGCLWLEKKETLIVIPDYNLNNQ